MDIKINLMEQKSGKKHVDVKEIGWIKVVK